MPTLGILEGILGRGFWSLRGRSGRLVWNRTIGRAFRSVPFRLGTLGSFQWVGHWALTESLGCVQLVNTVEYSPRGRYTVTPFDKVVDASAPPRAQLSRESDEGVQAVPITGNGKIPSQSAGG